MPKFLNPKLIFFAITISILFFSVFSVSAMTEQEKQAIIESIKQQIIAIQLQILQIQTQGKTSVVSSDKSWCHTFNVNLGTANNGSSEVGYLHTALKNQGFIIFDTEFLNKTYGTSTVQAVSAFQQKYASEILTPSGLTKGTGFFGSATRAKMNKIYGCDSMIGNNTVAINENLKNGTTTTDTTTKIVTALKNSTVSCTPSWKCSSYGQCVNGNQTRTCFDINGCGDANTKPNTTQSCTPEVCVPTWTCGDWGQCRNGSQIRLCVDSNICSTTTGRPSVSRACSGTSTTTITACTPSWTCTNWGTCSNSQQTRTCTDSNSCGTTATRPRITQSCTTACTPNCTNKQCGADDGCGSPCQTGCTNVACYTDSDCGSYITQQGIRASGDAVCSEDYKNVVREYFTPYCYDPGSATSVCSVQIERKTEEVCVNGCENGVCKGDTATTTPTVCTPNWTCGSWGLCTNGTQTRTCTDSTGCENLATRPAITQDCTPCTPNWQCSDWEKCWGAREQPASGWSSAMFKKSSLNPNGYTTTSRTCTDINQCNTDYGKPETTKDCPDINITATLNNTKASVTYNTNNNEVASDSLLGITGLSPGGWYVTLSWVANGATSCRLENCETKFSFSLGADGKYVTKKERVCSDSDWAGEVPTSSSKNFLPAEPSTDPLANTTHYLICSDKNGIEGAAVSVDLTPKLVGPYNVQVKGSCQGKVDAAIGILKSRLPDEYKKLREYVGVIKCGVKGTTATAYVGTEPPLVMVSETMTRTHDSFWIAVVLVHETCHHQLYTDYFWKHSLEPGGPYVPHEIYGLEPGERICKTRDYYAALSLGIPLAPNYVEAAMATRWWEDPSVGASE